MTVSVDQTIMHFVVSISVSGSGHTLPSLSRHMKKKAASFTMSFNPFFCLSEFVRISFPAKAISLILEVLNSCTVAAGCQLEASKSTLMKAPVTVCSSIDAGDTAAGASKLLLFAGDVFHSVHVFGVCCVRCFTKRDCWHRLIVTLVLYMFGKLAV